MTRRSFLANLARAAAVLALPAAVIAVQERRLHVGLDPAFGRDSAVTYCSTPVFPEYGYVIMHRRSSSFRRGDPLIP